MTALNIEYAKQDAIAAMVLTKQVTSMDIARTLNVGEKTVRKWIVRLKSKIAESSNEADILLLIETLATKVHRLEKHNQILRCYQI